MSLTLIRSVLEFVRHGWRPYNFQPAQKAYEKIKCPNAGVKGKRQPFWFVRDDMFACISCDRCCLLSRPEGFLLSLPIRYEKRNDESHLSPVELVKSKALLRVDETAYCLNISERTVYDWIAEGRLRRVKDAPVRVSAEDVARAMSDFVE